MDIQPAIVVDSSNKFQSFQNMFFIRSPSASNDQLDSLSTSDENQNFNFENETESKFDKIKKKIDDAIQQASGQLTGINLNLTGFSFKQNLADGWGGIGKSMMNHEGLFKQMSQHHNDHKSK